MNPETTLQMLEAQVKTFTEALPGIKSDPADMARLHAARLARKRMATALRWIGELADGLEVKKHLQRTRDLFSAMGEVRDLQLMQARLAAHSLGNKVSYDVFAAYLERHLASAQTDLVAELEMFREEEMEKMLAASRKALKKSSLVDFDSAAELHVKKLIKALSKVGDKLDEEKALHKLRGQIRECTLFLQMLKDTQSALPLSASETEAVKAMGARLGEWHDRLAFSETLTRWVKKHTSRKEGDPETVAYQSLREMAKKDVKDALAQLAPAPAAKASKPSKAAKEKSKAKEQDKPAPKQKRAQAASKPKPTSKVASGAKSTSVPAKAAAKKAPAKSVTKKSATQKALPKAAKKSAGSAKASAITKAPKKAK